jgi:hypothetical protein
MRTIETGKHKGKTLADCPKEYIEWASKHEKNFARRNQWISRDAQFILERMAQAIALKEYKARKEAEMAVKVAEQIARANTVKHSNFNTSRAFSLMR